MSRSKKPQDEFYEEIPKLDEMEPAEQESILGGQLVGGTKAHREQVRLAREQRLGERAAAKAAKELEKANKPNKNNPPPGFTKKMWALSLKNARKFANTVYGEGHGPDE